MLNEDRIRLMTNMAMYEQGKGRREFRINRLYKRDYVGLNMISTFFWVTIGYAIIVAMWAVVKQKMLIESLSDLGSLKTIGIRIVVIYVIILAVYLISLRIYYSRTHRIASNNVREYYAQLRRLEKSYLREEGIPVEDDEDEAEAPKKHKRRRRRKGEE